MSNSKPMQCSLWLRVMIVSVWVQLAVWVVKLPRILEMIESRPRYHASDQEIQSMLRFVASLSNHKWFILRRNCLKRSLVFYYFLVTSGISGLSLHIGISKPDHNLAGHCWLTLHGEVFQDSEHKISKYTIMYSRGV